MFWIQRSEVGSLMVQPLHQIMTDLKAVPENQLKFERCKCKTQVQLTCACAVKMGSSELQHVEIAEEKIAVIVMK